MKSIEYLYVYVRLSICMLNKTQEQSIQSCIYLHTSTRQKWLRSVGTDWYSIFHKFMSIEARAFDMRKNIQDAS